jgi:hypothetical protein
MKSNNNWTFCQQVRNSFMIKALRGTKED